MIDDLHHIGHIVDNLEQSVDYYTNILNGEVTQTGSVDEKVDVAFVDLPGYQMEVICRHERGTYLDGLLDTLLEQSRYHIAFAVSDIEASMEKFDTNGYEMYNNEPVDGLGSYARAFVDPSSTPGMPVELIEYK
ncbi:MULTISPECIES: VOC family protein [Natrialbaceae]|uniref:VOC family protein n=1 Tax=Natrialbaceae TaxID=1644061 RepID=UPI00207C4220|nr:VOC family protein [Natronococcus sp. CG52]